MPDRDYENYIKSFVDMISKSGERSPLIDRLTNNAEPEGAEDYGNLRYALLNHANTYGNKGEINPDLASEIIRPLLESMGGDRRSRAEAFGKHQGAVYDKRPPSNMLENNMYDADAIMRMLLGKR